MQLEKIYNRYDHFFLTFEERTTKETAKKENVYFIKNPKRNLPNAFICFIQSLVVFLKEKPNIVISTGAGVTVFICYIARFFMRKVIFIESFSRVTEPSITGRLVYPISNLFIIQWKPLIKFYKKAVYGGLIF
jgi:hypothetical protein